MKQETPPEERERDRRKRRRWLLPIGAIICTFLVGEAAFRLFPLDSQLDYRFDEECYWSLKPNQTGRLWMGGGRFRSPVIRIGNDGFRECEGRAAPADAAEILFLGDSYTFGLGVEDRETFCSRMPEFVAHIPMRTRNGGSPGYGAFQSAALLRRELASGRIPDLVVLTLPTGDVLRQPFPQAKFEEYRATQQRRKRLRDVSRVATFVYRRLVQWKGRGAAESRAVPNQRRAEALDGFRKLWESDAERIRGMKELCDQRGVRFVVLHWPQSTREGWVEIVESGLESLALETGLTALTGLADRFEGRNVAELTIPGDGHPSVVAHEIVAGYLAEKLEPLLTSEGMEQTKDE